MAEIKLETALNDPELESMLVGLLSLVEMRFPGRIRACYLGGSRSDGSAVLDAGTDHNASDLDVLVVFAGNLVEGEASRLLELEAACSKLSKVWLDITLVSEEQLRERAFQTTTATVLVKLAKIFLYGTDIRSSIEFPPLENYRLWLTLGACYNIGSIRQTESVAVPFKTLVTYPVTQPDPESEFGGYDYYLRQHPDGTYYPGRGGLRWMVAGVLWLATSRLAHEHGCYTATKKETVSKYAELVHDEHTDLVEQLFEYGKLKWRYLVPTNPADRAHLTELCQRLPSFENQALERGKTFLLQLIAEGVSDERKPEVREALQMIDFGEPVFREWLLQNPPSK